MSTILDRRIFQPHDIICQAGNDPEYVWILLRGNVELSGGALGKVRFSKSPGSLYGDLEALLDIPYQGNLIAIGNEPSELARFPSSRIVDQVNKSSSMVRALIKINAVRVLKASRIIHLNELKYDVADALLECLMHKH
jgi:CRP-like cAMP-binding protein